MGLLNCTCCWVIPGADAILRVGTSVGASFFLEGSPFTVSGPSFQRDKEAGCPIERRPKPLTPIDFGSTNTINVNIHRPSTRYTPRPLGVLPRRSFEAVYFIWSWLKRETKRNMFLRGPACLTYPCIVHPISVVVRSRLFPPIKSLFMQARKGYQASNEEQPNVYPCGNRVE